MKLKSYFADSVAAAMAEAAKELGDDAMLVNSREAPPEARHLGSCEVVFAIGTASQSGSLPAASVPGSRHTGIAGGASRGEAGLLANLSQEVAELRRQMNRITGVMARSHPAAGEQSPLESELLRISEGLLDADLSADLVPEVIGRLRIAAERDEFTAAPNLHQRAIEATRDELAGMFSVDARVGSAREGAQTVVLVGPPGAGKTSALVKIAAAYGLQIRRPAQLLSLDMYRVGAAEQLRSFAAILGIGFQALETPLSLAQALEEHRHKDLILIDTPGHGLRDMDAGSELAAFLHAHPKIDVHLTVAASTKAADLKASVDRFEAFRPTKLLFTKLDETASPGTVLSEAIRTGKPISFLTDGQQIPEDFREATQSSVLDLVLANLANDLSKEPGAPPAAGPHWEGPAAERAAAA
jgi:flagellar biosynthesis protein FlhF